MLSGTNDRRPITPADYPNIENVVKKAVKEKQNFERLELPKEALLEMFAVSRPKSGLDGAKTDHSYLGVLSTTATNSTTSKTRFLMAPLPLSTDVVP
jgi:hypothetical protein